MKPKQWICVRCMKSPLFASWRSVDTAVCFVLTAVRIRAVWISSEWCWPVALTVRRLCAVLRCCSYATVDCCVHCIWRMCQMFSKQISEATIQACVTVVALFTTALWSSTDLKVLCVLVSTSVENLRLLYNVYIHSWLHVILDKIWLIVIT